MVAGDGLLLHEKWGGGTKINDTVPFKISNFSIKNIFRNEADSLALRNKNRHLM